MCWSMHSRLLVREESCRVTKCTVKTALCSVPLSAHIFYLLYFFGLNFPFFVFKNRRKRNTLLLKTSIYIYFYIYILYFLIVFFIPEVDCYPHSGMHIAHANRFEILFLVSQVFFPSVYGSVIMVLL
ncbi:hypothetical protein NQD34_000774 [Periophthalmus magnuspinnatus]|nr:hypothetical protein NQD34_000774 [Periophthalmus magnuspinnatus]